MSEIHNSERATSQTEKFSLSDSVRIKTENSSRTFSQTLAFFRSKFKLNPWNPWRLSAIQDWIIIIESRSLQFKHRTHRRKQRAQCDHREEVWEEEGKKFKESEPVKKKKENYRFIFGFKPRNPQTETNPRSVRRFRFKSPIKSQVKHVNLTLFHSRTHTDSGSM